MGQLLPFEYTHAKPKDGKTLSFLHLQDTILGDIIHTLYGA